VLSCIEAGSMIQSKIMRIGQDYLPAQQVGG
jgi:hypothetical protein